MANDFFRDISTAIFKPVGNFVGGAVTALQPGRVQQMRLRQRQQELQQQFLILKGEFSPEEKENAARTIVQMAQPKLYEQRLQQDPNAKFYQPILTPEEQRQKALDPYGRGYGKTGTDNIERAGKLGLAIERMDNAGMFEENEELKKSLTSYALKVIKEDDDLATYFDAGTKEKPITEIEEKEPKKRNIKNLLIGSVFPPYGAYRGIKGLQDYFQDSTETIPEKNIPATFEQIGVMNPQDQATFEEMQEAIPDRDLRQEYEKDAEGMQKLIKLWREKKLNKSNLHKAFSAIQQKAKESLMLA